VSNKIQAVIKVSQQRKSPGQDGFTAKFYQTFNKENPPNIP
jgi:hypothetical protein